MIEDKSPVLLFTCLVSNFEANFMLVGSKLGLGAVGKGMESCQWVKPIRNLTFSTEGSRYKLSVKIFPFPFHVHTDTHTKAWLHVYKAIYRKLCAEWVIKVQTPFFNRQKRRQRKSCPWLRVAANGMKRYQKIEKCRAIFLSIWAHIWAHI